MTESTCPPNYSVDRGRFDRVCLFCVHCQTRKWFCTKFDCTVNIFGGRCDDIQIMQDGDILMINVEYCKKEGLI